MNALILLLSILVIAPIIVATAMSGIFIGGGLVQENAFIPLADMIMWAGFIAAVLMAVLHGWGLLRHFRGAGSNATTRVLVWSPGLLCLIYFGAVLLIAP